MASKKKQLPWRTLAPLPEGSTGRFTAEQIEAAVLAVKAKREAREARARGKKQKTLKSSDTAAAKSSRKTPGR